MNIFTNLPKVLLNIVDQYLMRCSHCNRVIGAGSKYHKFVETLDSYAKPLKINFYLCSVTCILDSGVANKTLHPNMEYEKEILVLRDTPRRPKKRQKDSRTNW